MLLLQIGLISCLFEIIFGCSFAWSFQVCLLLLLCCSHLIYKWLKASFSENLVPLQTFSIIYAFLQHWAYCSSALFAMNLSPLCDYYSLLYKDAFFSFFFFFNSSSQITKKLNSFCRWWFKMIFLGSHNCDAAGRTVSLTGKKLGEKNNQFPIGLWT